MKSEYTPAELERIIEEVEPRTGWDFSRMKAETMSAPWDYLDVVQSHLNRTDKVLDIGTGGGENFLKLAPFFGEGTGVDADPAMIETARANARGVQKVSFHLDTTELADTPGRFDVILDRHAPFDLEAVKAHLAPGGLFITQQVGERNMANVKSALRLPAARPPVSRAMIEAAGLQVVDFREYDVEYMVKDVQSLVFWLRALDLLHADLAGGDALTDAETFNHVLDGYVDDRGFVTNEHRYLLVARTD
jgi:SAM-dependent methyltransferase